MHKIHTCLIIFPKVFVFTRVKKEVISNKKMQWCVPIHTAAGGGIACGERPLFDTCSQRQDKGVQLTNHSSDHHVDICILTFKKLSFINFMSFHELVFMNNTFHSLAQKNKTNVCFILVLFWWNDAIIDLNFKSLGLENWNKSL